MRTPSWYLRILIPGAVLAPALAFVACDGATLPSGATGGSDAGVDATLEASAPDAAVYADASSGDADAAIDVHAPIDGWAPIPGFEACEGATLQRPRTWPARAWSPCGTGCLQSPASTLSAAWVGRNATGASVFDGSIYYRSSTSTSDSQWTYEEIRRLPDDEVVFAMRFDGECYVSAVKDDAPFVVGAFLGPKDWVGTVDPKTGALSMNPQPFELNTVHRNKWWRVGSTWGVLAADQVRLALTPGESVLTAIEPSPSYKTWARSRGDRLVWIDWAAPASIRGWTPNQGAETITVAPADATGLSYGNALIAWVSVTGVDAIGGAYDTATIVWMPASASAGNAPISVGPDITQHVAGGPITATHGSRIAITAVPLDRSQPQGTLVYDTASNKLVFIPSASGTASEVLAMNDTELLLAEIDTNTFGEYTRYLRLDLAQLDSITIDPP